MSRPVAARRAPVAYGLVLLHPILATAFAFWAVNGILHCDDEKVVCHLGFAVHLLFPVVVGVVVAVAAGVAGLSVRPRGRLRTWLWLLLPTTLTWLTLWWALAVTAETSSAP